MAPQKLTNPRYWSANFGQQKLFKFTNNSYHKYLKELLTPDASKTCIEVGAYPGGNIGYMAQEYLYQPTALDFIEEIEFVDSVMRFNGIENCHIIHEDFLKWQPDMTYDVVCSHGFIEHFTNYEEVVEKHVEILSNHGTLILTVPYLEFYQRWIRKFLYTPEKYEKVLAVHNREIMNLERLKNLIGKKFNMNLLFAKYIKGMSIWFPANAQTIQMKKISAYKIAKRVGEFTKNRELSNRYISPEILIVARKN